MPKIQVITDEMLGKAKNIHQGAAEIVNSQSNVTKIIQNLGKDFSGKLPTLMVGNILSMKDKFKELNETLDQYGKFLTHAANTYEWNDKDMAKWATALGDRGKGIGAGTRPSEPGVPPDKGGPYVPPPIIGFTKGDDYYRSKYARNENNCKAFVNAMIEGELGGKVPPYTDKLYELQGLTPIENGQVVYNATKPLTENDIKNLFSNAKVGDVVQMRWTYGRQTQHSAIFAGFDEKGNVLFLESNVDPTGNNIPNISTHSYSYEKLKSYFSHNDNGASIYRIG